MSSLIDLNPAISGAGKEALHDNKIPAIEEIPEELRGKTLSADELDNLAQLLTPRIRNGVAAQLTPKRAVPIKDFSNLTQDAIYDPDIFMEAKAFMSGDPLKVVLKDTNYEPRWVSKNSQRLGQMKAMGFTYVGAEDIEGNLNIDLEPDTNGHFSYHDVVLMRVPKASYYPALRAAHERAKTVVSHQKAQKNGAAEANAYMMTEAKDDQGFSVASDFATAAGDGKLQFYHPGT